MGQPWYAELLSFVTLMSAIIYAIIWWGKA